MACSRLKGPLPDAQLLLVCHHHPEDLGQRQLPGSAAARTESAGAADLDAPFPSATNRASARCSVRPTQATPFKPALFRSPKLRAMRSNSLRRAAPRKRTCVVGISNFCVPEMQSADKWPTPASA